MIKRLATLLLFLHFSVAYSQTIKTDVLVIGGTPSGVAAAIQSARSKVKTILVEGGRIITQNADTVKNLSIDTNTKFVSIKKDDDRWEVVISTNGKIETIKPRVVIDATENSDVLKKANAALPGAWFVDVNDKTKLYRTSIASMNVEITSPPGPFAQDVKTGGFLPYSSYRALPIQAIIAKGADNLLTTQAPLSAANDIPNLPSQLAVGQGTGVTAAYCAFFKTTTANLKVRIIQGELLDFKGPMLPLTDIKDDPYWRVIQQICATGLIKGNRNAKQQFVFQPDSIVTTAEIKPVLFEIYSRAFLWFNAAKPGKKFTVGNLLSFISEITLTDPDNMQKSMAKDWKGKFKFTSEFDPERPVTRREFAILANQYLNPFGRAVDLDGRIIN